MSTKVIVVGGGLSGLSAAHQLIDRGANVLMLDKNAFFGGNSTKATSGINGAGTNSQGNLDIRDSAKTFYEDTIKSAADNARPDLVKVLTYHSGPAVHWLQDKFGLGLNRVSRLGGHSEPRTHRSDSKAFPGMEITMALMGMAEDEAKARPDRFQIIRKANVKSLIYEDNVVKGVEYEFNGQTHREYGPVVLATGGYAADFGENSMLKEFKPEYFDLPTTNGAHCTGDGQKMVRAIGGNLIDMDKVQVHPTGLVDPKEPDAKVKFLAAEALRGCGGLLIDNEGKRFVDELEKRAVVTAAMWKHDKFPVRLVLNGEASSEIDWHCKHYAGRGLMKKFESLGELAKEMKVEESTLKHTFDDYEQIGAGKKADPFKKKFHRNYKNSGPYYVAHMTPVLHYTMGGVEINDKAEVINKEGKVIPGLYACGEIGGGVHGANRLGGSSLLGCVVYGRVAGDSASAYMLEGMSSGKIAAGRANQIQQQLETRIRVNPDNSSLNVSFHWGEGEQQQSASGSNAATSAPASQSAQSAGPQAEQSEVKTKQEMKEYSLDDVAKHNKEEDVWVVVEGRVLDVTKFLPDHPGGAKAILLYKGKDATEEFLMMHGIEVIDKYAPETVIGTLKQ